jgi:cytochrome P450
MRLIFWETFLNVGSDRNVRRDAEIAAEQLHQYMDALIAERHTQIANAEETPDDLLTRLIQLQQTPESALSDEGIRRNLGGVVVGAVDTTSKATAQAIDQLLDRPAALRAATVAALNNDIKTLSAAVFEALRFNPINPFMVRHVARSTTVATGTRRQKTVKAGSDVFLGILPAMFDPVVFPNPHEFRTDRPIENYLHFGHGLHRCFGRYINLVQIPEIVGALLRYGNIRRPSPPLHQMQFEGPFPDRLLVEIQPHRGH